MKNRGLSIRGGVEHKRGGVEHREYTMMNESK